MERWWVDGQPGGSPAPDDRGLAYADGLFETMAVRGGRPRFLSRHLDRLLAGCARLSLPAPDRSSLSTDLEAACNGVRHGVLKLMLTAGRGPRGYARPPTPSPTVIWGVAGTGPVAAAPIAVRWCATMTPVSPVIAGLKTIGRLEQVLARAEWDDPAIAEGLMASTEGWVVGATAGNVFLVEEGRLVTPSVARCGVAGVMRGLVIDTARAAGLEVRVTDVSPATLAAASELFVTNALTGLRPVCRLDGHDRDPGPVSRQLQALLADAGVDECAG